MFRGRGLGEGVPMALFILICLTMETVFKHNNSLCVPSVCVISTDSAVVRVSCITLLVRSFSHCCGSLSFFVIMFHPVKSNNSQSRLRDSLKS